jgi:hypothetical protein
MKKYMISCYIVFINAESLEWVTSAVIRHCSQHLDHIHHEYQDMSIHLAVYHETFQIQFHYPELSVFNSLF